MSMHASAIIGWGVDLCDEDGYPVIDVSEWNEDYDKIYAAQGFTEPEPEPENYDDEWHEWLKRRDEACPVSMQSWGYGYEAQALMVTRTCKSTNGMKTEVTVDTTFPPMAYERECLDKVLDGMGFTGDRVPKLLLLALYG